MGARGLLIIALVAVLSLALGAWAAVTRPRSGPSPVETAGPLVPDLAARANDVADIRIRRGAETITIVRFGDRWVLAEKGGFPVRVDHVRALVAGLAAATLAEPRTADARRFARLAVEDPTLAGARSRLVELRGPQNALLARLIVGKPATIPLTPGRGAVYVRRPDDDRAWLADGEIPLPDAAVDWVERRIADFGPEHLRAVAVRGAAGQTLTLVRTAPTADQMVIEGEDGSRALPPAAAQRLIRFLGGLAFDDVRPAGEVPSDPVRTVDLFTFDGLRLRFDVVIADGQPWVRLQAAIAPTRFGAVPAAVVGSMAAAISQAADGWAFRLAPWRMDALTAPYAEWAATLPRG